MGVSSMSAGGAQATLLGLQEMLVYGLKGVCAYAHHAEMLGKVRGALPCAFIASCALCIDR